MQLQQESYEQELREARDTLEQRVTERTTELVAATDKATRTRAQLTSAIETISDGFSLFDSEDRLVICNTRYRELLRRDSGHTIEPGTKFEDINRDAVREGLITDAEGRVEDWIANRVAQHRDPSEPHLQHRNDGRWILISERKTV